MTACTLPTWFACRISPARSRWAWSSPHARRRPGGRRRAGKSAPQTRSPSWQRTSRGKEQLPNQPVIGHMLVAEDRLANGTIRSLWATVPTEAYRSRCHYLDMQASDGTYSGFSSCGGGPASGATTVSLGGTVEHVVGDTGTWAATQVRITAGHLVQTVPVAAGYVLVPEQFTTAAGEPLTLTLLGADGSVIGVVRDLTPLGSGAVVVPGR